MDPGELFDRRLLLVTGKGGVGKSSVAAALAVASARTGRRTCLVEVEGRQTFSHLFQTQAWDFTEREFRPELFGLSIDPEASLTQYLDMFYGARRISRFVVGSPAVEFATTAAPGIKDVLLIGKVKEMERRRDEDGRFHYDLVVVDAPPTGRIVNFLRAPDAATELVHVGPIRSQAQSVIDMLLDPERTSAVLVTLAEEMPVTETVESAHALRDFGVAVGPVLVNRILPERFDEEAAKALGDRLDAETVRALLAGEELEVSPGGASGLLEAGQAYLARLDLQRRMCDELEHRLRLRRIDLPELYAPAFGDDEIAVLAEHLLAACRGQR